eukprot:gene17244-23706_t
MRMSCDAPAAAAPAARSGAGGPLDVVRLVEKITRVVLAIT